MKEQLQAYSCLGQSILAILKFYVSFSLFFNCLIHFVYVSVWSTINSQEFEVLMVLHFSLVLLGNFFIFLIEAARKIEYYC